MGCANGRVVDTLAVESRQGSLYESDSDSNIYYDEYGQPYEEILYEEEEEELGAYHVHWGEPYDIGDDVIDEEYDYNYEESEVDLPESWSRGDETATSYMSSRATSSKGPRKSVQFLDSFEQKQAVHRYTNSPRTSAHPLVEQRQAYAQNVRTHGRNVQAPSVGEQSPGFAQDSKSPQRNVRPSNMVDQTHTLSQDVQSPQRSVHVPEIPEQSQNPVGQIQELTQDAKSTTTTPDVTGQNQTLSPNGKRPENHVQSPKTVKQENTQSQEEKGLEETEQTPDICEEKEKLSPNKKELRNHKKTKSVKKLQKPWSPTRKIPQRYMPIPNVVEQKLQPFSKWRNCQTPIQSQEEVEHKQSSPDIVQQADNQDGVELSQQTKPSVSEKKQQLELSAEQIQPLETDIAIVQQQSMKQTEMEQGSQKMVKDETNAVTEQKQSLEPEINELKQSFESCVIEQNKAIESDVHKQNQTHESDEIEQKQTTEADVIEQKQTLESDIIELQNHVLESDVIELKQTTESDALEQKHTVEPDVIEQNQTLESDVIEQKQTVVSDIIGEKRSVEQDEQVESMQSEVEGKQSPQEANVIEQTHALEDEVVEQRQPLEPDIVIIQRQTKDALISLEKVEEEMEPESSSNPQMAEEAPQQVGENGEEAPKAGSPEEAEAQGGTPEEEEDDKDLTSEEEESEDELPKKPIDCRAPSLSLWYNDNEVGDILTQDVYVPSSGLTKSTYYCCLQWNAGRNGGGYCGIQDHERGRNYIFSIWDPVGASEGEAIKPVYQGAGTICEPFGGEGTGLKSWNFDLGWDPDCWYTLVTRRWDYNEHTYYGLWVKHHISGTWTHLVTVDFPVPGICFDTWTCSFLEDWQGTGNRERRVHFKNGYKRRKEDGTWIPFTKAVFSVVREATSRKYENNFDSGTLDETFYLQCGGKTSPTEDMMEGECLYRDMYECPEELAMVCNLTLVTDEFMCWDISSETVPQFRYAITVDGEQVKDETDSEVREFKFESPPQDVVELVVEDIYGRTATCKFLVKEKRECYDNTSTDSAVSSV